MLLPRENEDLARFRQRLFVQKNGTKGRRSSKKKKARGMGKKKALSLDKASCVSGGGTPKRVVYYRCKLKKK
jgi:hypothetical protein